MDKQAEFELLVMNTLYNEIKIDWSAPRLLHTEDFNKDDATEFNRLTAISNCFVTNSSTMIFLC